MTTTRSRLDEADGTIATTARAGVIRRSTSAIRSPFMRGAAVLFSATTLANVGAYVFSVIAGRALGPEDYGALIALVSLLAFVSVPATGLQTLAAREMAAASTESEVVAHALSRHLVFVAAVLGAAAFAIFAAISIPVARVMSIDAPVLVMWIGFAGATAIGVAALRGIAQGRRQFALLGVSLSADPLLRIGILVGALLVGLRIGAGVAAYVGTAVVLWVALWIVEVRAAAPGRAARAREPRPAHISGWRPLVPLSLFAAVTAVLMNIDLLAARAVLSKEQAGFYAAAAILGRVVFFVGGAASAVVLPFVSREATNAAARHRVLLEALAFTAALAGGALLVYGLAPGLVVRLTFGGDYAPVAGVLVRFGIELFLFALANVGISYLIAVRRLGVLPFLGALVLADAALLLRFHGSVETIVGVQIAVMVALNVVTWLPIAREPHWSWRAAAR